MPRWYSRMNGKQIRFFFRCRLRLWDTYTQTHSCTILLCESRKSAIFRHSFHSHFVCVCVCALWCCDDVSGKPIELCIVNMRAITRSTAVNGNDQLFSFITDMHVVRTQSHTHTLHSMRYAVSKREKKEEKKSASNWTKFTSNDVIRNCLQPTPVHTDTIASNMPNAHMMQTDSHIYANAFALHRFAINFKFYFRFSASRQRILTMHAWACAICVFIWCSLFRLKEILHCRQAKPIGNRLKIRFRRSIDTTTTTTTKWMDFRFAQSVVARRTYMYNFHFGVCYVYLCVVRALPPNALPFNLIPIFITNTLRPAVYCVFEFELSRYRRQHRVQSTRHDTLTSNSSTIDQIKLMPIAYRVQVLTNALCCLIYVAVACIVNTRCGCQFYYYYFANSIIRCQSQPDHGSLAAHTHPLINEHTCTRMDLAKCTASCRKRRKTVWIT